MFFFMATEPAVATLVCIKLNYEKHSLQTVNILPGLGKVRVSKPRYVELRMSFDLAAAGNLRTPHPTPPSTILNIYT